MNLSQEMSIRARSYFPLATCLLLGLFASVLSVYFSRDVIGYKHIFTIVTPRTWSYFLDHLNLLDGPLFRTMVFVLGNSIGFAASMTLMIVFFLTIKLKYLGRVTNDFYLGTFFYTCFYLLLLEGTIARASFALTLVVVAIYHLKQQQFWQCLFFILLGSQIHLSAILFLLLFPLYFIPQASRIVWTVFILAPLCAIFKVSVFSAVIYSLGVIDPKYLKYSDTSFLVTQNSTELFFPFIGFFALLLVGVVYPSLREQISVDRFTRAMFLTCMTGVISMWLFYDRVVVAARLGELLLLPIIILLCKLDVKLRDRQLVVGRRVVYAISASYFLARFYYLYIR